MLGSLIADMGATVAADVAKPNQEPAAQPAAREAPPVAEIAAAPAAPREVVTNLKPRKPAKASGQGTLRDRSKQLSLYLEEPVYDQIREIAHVERKKMHQLIVEAIDLLLKKKGSPSISELLKKAG